METMSVVLTKRGLPALWESGGGSSNTGRAVIITNKDGEPKKPVYIRRKGQLSNSNHALIVIRERDHVLTASHHRGDFTISIYEIETLDKEEQQVSLKEVNTFSEGEWDYPLEEDSKFNEAIRAAKKKARTYHCRSPFFISPAE